MTDADLFRAKVEWETDTTVTGTFKRDQHLTPESLFKAKVLAVINDERLKWGYSGEAEDALNWAQTRIEAIQP